MLGVRFNYVKPKGIVDYNWIGKKISFKTNLSNVRKPGKEFYFEKKLNEIMLGVKFNHKKPQGVIPWN